MGTKKLKTLRQAPGLLLPEQTGGDVLELPASSMQSAQLRKTGKNLEILVGFAVACGLVWALVNEDTIRADVEGKVEQARTRLATLTEGASPCGIPAAERASFNTGWEIGHEAAHR